MRRLLIFALLAAPVFAWGQGINGGGIGGNDLTNSFVTPNGGTQTTLGAALASPTGNVSGATATATGTTTARTLAARAADLVNVRNYGALGNGQIATPTVTLSGTSLTVGTSLFAATDVGKTIVIANAGTAPTTGTVMNIPTTSPGSGYTAVPTCAVTDASSSGSGATCSALMAIQSVTLTTGGVACLNGTDTFLVGIDGTGTPAQFTGVVSGGVLSGSLTLVSGGNFTAMGATTSVPVYGANCTTAPTVSVSYGVGAVSVTAVGAAYTTAQTTAALTGGSPSVAAVVGTPQFGAPIPPLVTTIAGYTSPTQVTLTAAAGTVITGTATEILWATDDSAAFQNAINAGSGIWVPGGLYWIGTKLDPGAGSLTIRGEGMANTILAWDSGSSTSQDSGAWYNVFRHKTSVNAVSELEFEDFQIRGVLDFGRTNTGGPALELNNYSGLKLNRVKFFQIPWMANQNEAIMKFTVTDSIFDTVMRDQARCRQCFADRIIGNKFIHSDDDSVALHTIDYLNAPGDVREGIVVEGNDFEDTTCVDIAGARSVVVRGNSFRRCKGSAIHMSSGSTEATYPMRGIIISDNVATDTVARIPTPTASSCVICVLVNVPNAPTGVTSMLPGSNSYPSAYFAKPWDYDINSTNAGAAFAAGARSIQIHDNVIMRTLPAVANYSAWGFGMMLTNSGFLDPPMSDVAMRPLEGVQSSDTATSVDIHHNNVQNVGIGILLRGAITAPSQASVSVSFNRIYDAVTMGIQQYEGGTATSVDIIGNTIDVDPFGLAANRNFGAWASGSPNLCVSVQFAGPVKMALNTFSNCYSIQTSINWVMSDNIVRGQVASGTTGQTGTWSSANQGMGVFPVNVGKQFFISPVTSNPGLNAPATLGGIALTHVTSAAALPTSGYHVVGDMIWSTAPATCACIGWMPITTGSSWTAGTDTKLVPLQ
jgi:hypothetical protein